MKKKPELLESVPKYKQLKEIIIRRIRFGEYPEGGKMPSENELSAEFQVSKHTVIKTLTELVNEGVLVRHQGKGTFLQSREKRRKNRIAVIVFHCDNPYYSKIVRVLEDRAHANACHIVLCNSEGNPEKEASYIKKLIKDVDGFLVCPVYCGGKASPGMKIILEKEVNCVFVASTPVPEKVTGIPCVVPDDVQGGYLATRHLIEKGYTKILFLSVKGFLKRSEIHDRFLGYQNALSEANIPFRKEWMIETTNLDPLNGYRQDGYFATKKILPMLEERTALFFIGDSLAIGMLKGLREESIQIPDRVGLCGYDNIDISSQWGVDLTTVAHPIAQMGGKSMEMLFERMDGRTTEERVVLPVELKVRKSTVAEKRRITI
ncbi:MAG: GntR family transcriptional regulator [Candidatus Ratteibacteria bacterium]|jgi:DNA-binding LacI/PurR family transcriptional regulator